MGTLYVYTQRKVNMKPKETSLQWWNRIKASPADLADWLRDQYHGEATAVIRILNFINTHVEAGSKWVDTLFIIADQEAKHSDWVKTLLETRGIPAEILQKDERYWNKTLASIDSFESGAAVAALAEKMRLERIEVIANDPDAPEDIRSTFQKILKEEQFHAKAFAEMAGDEAMRKALSNHELGMAEIGLIPTEA